MSEIKFSKEDKGAITIKLQQYFNNELDHDLGQFEAEFLIDFISKEIGAYYYNQGLNDARLVVESKIEAIDEAIYAIEKET